MQTDVDACLIFPQSLVATPDFAFLPDCHHVVLDRLLLPSPTCKWLRMIYTDCCPTVLLILPDIPCFPSCPRLAFFLACMPPCLSLLGLGFLPALCLLSSGDSYLSDIQRWLREWRIAMKSRRALRRFSLRLLATTTSPVHCWFSEIQYYGKIQSVIRGDP
jgi:hypothetical protein